MMTRLSLGEEIMKKLIALTGALVLVLGLTSFSHAQNVINFESSQIDVLADDTYQASTPFFPGVVIEGIDNVTGAFTNWPVVVRAKDGGIPAGTTCAASPKDGTVPGFNSVGNSCDNYPVASGVNSLSDTSEGLPPSVSDPRNNRDQDGFRVSFAYPVQDVSATFPDWGDYLPPKTGFSCPCYIEMTAYDKDGNLINTASGPVLDSADSNYDATKANGQTTVTVTGNGIRTVEVRFIGLIDPGVTIDDITFTGPQEVTIDIKPGSDPNSINKCKRGLVPIAILGSADFDVNTISPAQACTVDDQALAMRGRTNYLYSVEDVNDDGFDDLVLHFEVENLNLEEGDTELTVLCPLESGGYVTGTDAIRVVDNHEECPWDN
jgi:hypothetical protein